MVSTLNCPVADSKDDEGRKMDDGRETKDDGREKKNEEIKINTNNY